MAAEVSSDDALPALTLLGLPRVGVREWHRRVREAGGVGPALARVPDSVARQQAVGDAASHLSRATALGARLLVHGAPGYPAVLNDLTDCEDGAVTPAPPVLFALGDLALLARPAVALVGTRQATPAGLRAAERIAQACAEAGALVISGLARGIDAAAHNGALVGRGATAAVIGTGVDIVYPSAHRGLQRRIAEEGLVITEHAPGQRPTRGSFPERNRLIAALAQVTVVVEAGHRSGALLTAQAAESLNRTTAAVPGAFDSAASLGSNLLLREGAHVITCVDDVLALLKLARADTERTDARALLTPPERAIWDVIGTSPLELDVIVERAGWAAEACLAAVTMLELRGLVRATTDGALHRT
jgi:DNA processing protein